ncbi:hypothetical protein C4K11_4908 [Pseudomonas chlororaphis subsp. aureofaciens]|nr:hypothetical protein C4K11_4908 [Pseudomonas chlororaphis subsp. aureofaciens]
MSFLVLREGWKAGVLKTLKHKWRSTPEGLDRHCCCLNDQQPITRPGSFPLYYQLIEKNLIKQSFQTLYN